MIPGSRGDLSWLVKPVEGAEEGLRSLAHGAGRKIARSEVKGKIRKLYNHDTLRQNKWGGKVVCGEDLLAWEEAPEAYKPISTVINDLTNAGLITPVAAFRPIVTFKTSEVETDENRRDPREWQDERRAARDKKYRNFR
jgi:release factor H-coupled RctB family protein